MTFEEANEKVKQLRNKVHSVFCPHIKEMCKKNCLCYHEPEAAILGCRMTENEEVWSYHVVQWRCSYK